MSTLSVLFYFFFMSLGVLHFYWALGGSWALRETIPHKKRRPIFKPNFFIMITLSLGLMFIAALFIALSWPQPYMLPWLDYIAWFLAFIFFARAVGDFNLVGFTKKVNDSPFAYWDTRLYSPLCIATSLTLVLLTFKH